MATVAAKIPFTGVAINAWTMEIVGSVRMLEPNLRAEDDISCGAAVHKLRVSYGQSLVFLSLSWLHWYARTTITRDTDDSNVATLFSRTRLLLGVRTHLLQADAC